jgi:tetratricopeptide (TPR) repeat protein
MVDKRFASDEAIAVELLVNIGDVYTFLEETDNATRSMKRAYDTSRRLADPHVRASAACGWARAVAQQGDYAGARQLFDEALGLLSDDAIFDNIAANCLIDRSYIAGLEGDTAATLRDAQTALERLGRAPEGFAWTRANALHALALGYDMQGDTAKADDAYADGMQQLERLGRGDTSAAAILLNNWAVTRAANDALGALALQERSLAMLGAGEVGESAPAAVLAQYGRLLNRLTRYAEARDVFDRAAAIARAHENVRTVGTSGIGRACACRNLGDLDCAEAALREAEPALRSSLPAEHFFLADLLHEQGLLSAARGDSASARRQLSDALALHEKASEKHGSHIDTLLELAELELAANRTSEAEQYARRALANAEALMGNLPHSNWVGLSQRVLGEVALTRSDRPAARALFAQALAHLSPTLGESHPATQQLKVHLAALP